MTTCSKCGMTTQSEAYHVCKTMSEERVREIALEEIRKFSRADGTSAFHEPGSISADIIRDSALEEAASLDCIGTYSKRRIRELKSQPAQPSCGTPADNQESAYDALNRSSDALNTISDIVNCTNTASAKLADIHTALEKTGRHPQPHKEPAQPVAEKPVALDEYGNLPPHHYMMSDAEEIATLTKERDALLEGRAKADREYKVLHEKLADANNALDEIEQCMREASWPSVCMHNAVAAIKRTGRLGGAK